MPALQPAAKPDKAMTIDLAALQSANAAQTPASSAAAAPSPADTDFSEPQNPWVAPKPAAAPSQSAAPPAPSVAPAAQPSKAAAPAGNPWAALQSQRPARPSVAAPAAQPSRAAANPAAPSEMAQTMPAQPAVPSDVPAAAPSNGTAAAPPQRQCFTNSEGVKICYMDDYQRHNTTDVHKEGGVNDYHNQNSANGKEGIQGHVTGNNVTNSLNNIGQNPPPNQNKDGSTSFQGKTEINANNQHDVHKDKSTFTDHDQKEGDLDSDWKSAYKGPDGSKEMAEINKDAQFKDVEDTKVNADDKDKTDVEEWNGSNDHRFLSDKPGTKNDGALTWDQDKSGKKQSQEFQGKGVYDLHEESSSKSSVKASVDGDQGWDQFDQNMNNFDTFFDNDGDWKAKMEDPRYKAAAAQMAKRQDRPFGKLSPLMQCMVGDGEACGRVTEDDTIQFQDAQSLQWDDAIAARDPSIAAEQTMDASLVEPRGEPGYFGRKLTKFACWSMQAHTPTCDKYGPGSDSKRSVKPSEEREEEHTVETRSEQGGWKCLANFYGHKWEDVTECDNKKRSVDAAKEQEALTEGSGAESLSVQKRAVEHHDGHNPCIDKWGQFDFEKCPPRNIPAACYDSNGDLDYDACPEEIYGSMMARRQVVGIPTGDSEDGHAGNNFGIAMAVLLVVLIVALALGAKRMNKCMEGRRERKQKAAYMTQIEGGNMVGPRS